MELHVIDKPILDTYPPNNKPHLCVHVHMLYMYYARTRTHACTHARMLTHTHTHTHTSSLRTTLVIDIPVKSAAVI